MKNSLKFIVSALPFLVVFTANTFFPSRPALGNRDTNIVEILQLKSLIETIGEGRVRHPLMLATVIFEDCKKHRMDPFLILAVIQTESSFRARVSSSKGARGLMQIMLPTGKEIARKLKWKKFMEKDLLDPVKNVRMGIYYLSKLKKRFNEKIFFLTAYNNGAARLKRTLRATPKADLQFTYAKSVLMNYAQLKYKSEK